jgi:glycosyltransferase involved in cell wall biosynthesis
VSGLTYLMPNTHHDITAPSVSVLVPAYNEEATIGAVLVRLLDLSLVKEVIVVDDCSADRTASIVASMNDARIKLIRQPKNGGKTSAIQRALQEVTGSVVIVQDADLEYDPAEVPSVVEPILSGHADVVYGSRFLVKPGARFIGYYHSLANHSLTVLSNMLNNLDLTDVETCYKAFRADIIRGIPLVSKGFGMEIELTASIARLGLRIREVPISYHGRTYEEGKKIGVRDGIAALWYIVYFNTLEPLSQRRQRYFSEVRARLAASRTAPPASSSTRPETREN